MLSGYIEIAKKNFQSSMAFRMNTFMGILNTFIIVLINISIWRALYGNNTTINGVSFMMMVTNLIIGIGISNVFNINEFFVSAKIRTGAITVDLLRPMSFQGYVLAYNLGMIFYKIVVEFFPTLILCFFIFGLLPPISFIAFLFFLISLSLGFLVLYNLSYILSMISFWYFNIWSFVTIKNALIVILSGIYLPYWFMPDWLRNIVGFTPFEALYAIPMGLYFGRIDISSAALLMGKQVLWIALLWSVGQALWKIGCKRLVIQGG
jgi:ABC-2 type transport system permease protein